MEQDRCPLVFVPSNCAWVAVVTDLPKADLFRDGRPGAKFSLTSLPLRPVLVSRRGDTTPTRKHVGPVVSAALGTDGARGPAVRRVPRGECSGWSGGSERDDADLAAAELGHVVAVGRQQGDGFRLAERDLRDRGVEGVLVAMQSGAFE